MTEFPPLNWGQQRLDSRLNNLRLQQSPLRRQRQAECVRTRGAIRAPGTIPAYNASPNKSIDLCDCSFSYCRRWMRRTKL